MLVLMKTGWPDQFANLLPCRQVVFFSMSGITQHCRLQAVAPPYQESESDRRSSLTGGGSLTGLKSNTRGAAFCLMQETKWNCADYLINLPLSLPSRLIDAVLFAVHAHDDRRQVFMHNITHCQRWVNNTQEVKTHAYYDALNSSWSVLLFYHIRM